MPETTDYELIRSLQDSHSDRWNTFVVVYKPYLQHCVVTVGVRSSEAEDVANNALIAIQRHLSKFQRRFDRGSLRSWMKTIARRHGINHLRKLDRTPGAIGSGDSHLSIDSVASDQDVDPAEQAAVIALYERCLRAAEASCSEIQIRSFQMKICDELSDDEVAEALGISRDSVRKNVSRVRQRVRDILIHPPTSF